jgi:hypothetical protein
MSYKSIIENLAKEDLRNTAKWYDTQQNGLGKKFFGYSQESYCTN